MLMKKLIVLSLLAISVSSCEKFALNYYCSCTTHYSHGGVGTYTGAKDTKGNAEVDCKEKKTGAEMNGHTIDCEILQEK